MSIDKMYEICCDECGATFHGDWTIADTEEDYVKSGGIIKRSKKGKKHYCDNDCYTIAQLRQNNKEIKCL